MQSQRRFSDWAHIIVYTVVGLALLVVASDDTAPLWTPWLVAGLLMFGVGFCAYGRHQAAWKMVLWILPGFLASLLLLTWGIVSIRPNSTVSLGPRFTVDATPTQLVIVESAPPGTWPVLMQIPWLSPWMREAWHSHIRMKYMTINASANTPGAIQIPNPGNGALMWVTMNNAVRFSVPIWWPIGVLGIPTLVCAAVIFPEWVRRRMRAP